ncbi:hypothetical protein [Streptomyces sp. NPDC008141]|uniref:hypothetical protein n=1 Tax=Streptomyces sp. NPDC008141 TaxID=3364815 RepID=UPI0036EC2B4F
MSQRVAAGHDQVVRPTEESRTINHLMAIWCEAPSSVLTTTTARVYELGLFMERVKGIEPAL